MTPKRLSSYGEFYYQIISKTLELGTWEVRFDDKREAARLRSTFYGFVKALHAANDPTAILGDKVSVRVKNDGLTLEFEDREQSKFARTIKAALGPQYAPPEPDFTQFKEVDSGQKN